MSAGRGEDQGSVGWLYVGDDGIEWSASHPVRSGEMPDAQLIRRATSAELLGALKDAWEAARQVAQGFPMTTPNNQSGESAVTISVDVVEGRRLAELMRNAWMRIQQGKRSSAPLAGADPAPFWDLANMAPDVIAYLDNHAGYEREIDAEEAEAERDLALAEAERLREAVTGAVNELSAMGHSCGNSMRALTALRAADEIERLSAAPPSPTAPMDRVTLDGDQLDDLAISGSLIELIRLEDLGGTLWGKLHFHDGRALELKLWASRGKVKSLVEWDTPPSEIREEGA